MIWRQKFAAMVSAATESWRDRAFSLAAFGSYPRFFLYYRESTEDAYGQLAVLPEDGTAPAGFKLADAEPLGPGMTLEQVQKRIHDVAYRLPVLPSGKDVD
jgi:hypothetical protein